MQTLRVSAADEAAIRSGLTDNVILIPDGREVRETFRGQPLEPEIEALYDRLATEGDERYGGGAPTR
jgi:hypothetical protein